MNYLFCFFTEGLSRLLMQSVEMVIDQEIQNMYQDNKEYVEKIETLHEILSKEKDEQILFLKAQVERLIR